LFVVNGNSRERTEKKLNREAAIMEFVSSDVVDGGERGRGKEMKTRVKATTGRESFPQMMFPLPFPSVQFQLSVFIHSRHF
jgi:hypothetical protein